MALHSGLLGMNMSEHQRMIEDRLIQNHYMNIAQLSLQSLPAKPPEPKKEELNLVLLLTEE